MATSVNTAIGGQLTASGDAIIWCGSCGCEGSTETKVFNFGRVGPGSYSVQPLFVPGCNVKHQGQFGVFGSFNGTQFSNPEDGGIWIFAPGTLSISLIEDYNPIDPLLRRFDCINGGCLPANTYGTPGIFSNLASCQNGCAKNSNCLGECVSETELTQLKQAAGNLRSRYCK